LQSNSRFFENLPTTNTLAYSGGSNDLYEGQRISEFPSGAFKVSTKLGYFEKNFMAKRSSLFSAAVSDVDEKFGIIDSWNNNRQNNESSLFSKPSKLIFL
jgi:hypothetical protein